MRELIRKISCESSSRFHRYLYSAEWYFEFCIRISWKVLLISSSSAVCIELQFSI